MIISDSALLGLFLLGLLVGRAIQNWCNRTGEAERLAYRDGYQAGINRQEPEI